MQYNCFIISWVLAQHRSCSECYCASDYDDDSFELFEETSPNSEAEVVIVSFKWLADRGYFTPEKKQFDYNTEKTDEVILIQKEIDSLTKIVKDLDNLSYSTIGFKQTKMVFKNNIHNEINKLKSTLS